MTARISYCPYLIGLSISRAGIRCRQNRLLRRTSDIVSSRQQDVDAHFHLNNTRGLVSCCTYRSSNLHPLQSPNKRYMVTTPLPQQTRETDCIQEAVHQIQLWVEQSPSISHPAPRTPSRLQATRRITLMALHSRWPNPVTHLNWPRNGTSCSDTSNSRSSQLQVWGS